MTNKKISVVIPGYNEGGNIEELYRRLTKVLSETVSTYELIFIHDGSTDNSREILTRLALVDKRVIVLFFSRKSGSSQVGFTAGSEYATGDAVVWIESDLQDPPELIPTFVAKWQEGYDVVYGVRTRRKGSIILRAAYKTFYVIFQKMSVVSIPRDAGDFSLLDRKVIDIINAMPERDRFMRGLRAWVGFRSVGVPYTRDLRYQGVTSNNWRKLIWWAKKAIFSFSYAPIEFIFYLALIAFILSVIAFIAYFVNALIGNPPRGLSTLLLIVIFFGSVQLLSLSIIAEYISRIFEEVKRRPKYIVDEVLGTIKK